MRLAVFCPYYPPHNGGLESHAAEFNAHLAPLVERIVVFTPRLPHQAAPKEVTGNLTILRFPAIEIIANFPFPKFWTQEYRSLYRELTAVEPDIVLSRTRFFITSIMARQFARGRRLKWFHIEHGSDYVQLNSRWKSAIARLYDETLGRLVFRSSTANIAISEAAATFIGKFDRRSVTVIHRGMEIAELLAIKPNRAIAKKYSGKIRLAFVGRLFDGKGVLDLLTALKPLKRHDWVCFIIGDGPQRPILEEKSRQLGLDGQVIFFGNQPRSDAVAILKTADIFINPSYTEGLPTSVVEAAIAGCAVIATDVGGTREIFTDQQEGLLIQPRRPKGITRALNKLMNDRELSKRLGQAIHTRVINHFDWQRSIQHYLECFTKTR